MTNRLTEPPTPLHPPNIPEPGTLPKPPQTIFILETDDRGASALESSPSRQAS